MPKSESNEIFLRDLLKNYCDALIGEPPTVKENSSIQNFKKSKIKKVKNKSKSFKSDISNNLNISCSSELSHSALDKGPSFTEDGFKIVDSIPSDDSDVSYAFDCDDEENFPSKSSKSDSLRDVYTSDGFKIVSHISSDESDVAEGFESDIDEEEWMEDTSEKLYQDPLRDSVKKLEPDPGKTIHSKSIERLIKEFDLDTFNSLEKKVVRAPNNTTLASRLKPPQVVTVVDYSQRRGKRKRDHKKRESDMGKHNTEGEAALKKAKHEVFKLGISKNEGGEKRGAKIALAVSLGAKPPKNPAVNYKILQHQRTEERMKRKVDEEVRTKTKMMATKKGSRGTAKKNSKATSSSGRSKFKDGVLTLSKNYLKRMNTKS